jgi:hypothetical protein
MCCILAARPVGVDVGLEMLALASAEFDAVRAGLCEVGYDEEGEVRVTVSG